MQLIPYLDLGKIRVLRVALIGSSNHSNNMLDNDVNRTGTKNGESPSSGRCPMAQQHGPGRHPTTAGRMRRKWTQQENRVVMECLFLIDQRREVIGKEYICCGKIERW